MKPKILSQESKNVGKLRVNGAEIGYKPGIKDIRQRTYDFSLRIIQLVKDFPNNRIGWVFSDQLLRAGTSISANLVEAKSSVSKKDFARYYRYAMKSANETIHWLKLVKDAEVVRNGEIDKLIDEADQIARILGAIITKIKD